MPAPKTAALASRAARRALARDAVHFAGRGLLLGAVSGLVLVGADRFFGGLLPSTVSGPWLWPCLLGVPAALGTAAGLTVAIVHRWRADRAALEVDRSLGLKERLSSALALAEHPSPDSAFEQLAIRDAESAAGSITLARALPIRPEWTWAAWPAVAAGAVAIAMLVPRVQWRSPAPSPAVEAAQIKQAAADVRDAAQAARQAVEQTLADRGVMDVASTDQLKQLESLERELLSSKSGAGEARVKAAESLESLADQLQEKAREDQAANDALREQLADSQAPAEGPASPLAEALRAGDMGAAQQAARDLLGKINGMSEEERQALARDLEKLAEQVKAAPTTEPADSPKSPDAPATPSGDVTPGQPPPESPSGERLQPPAPREQPPADVANETDPDRIREKLEEKGVPPDQSQRLAEDIARENRNREARDQARRDAEKLRESLRDAAKEARDPKAREQAAKDGSENQRKDGQEPETKGTADNPGERPIPGDPSKQGDQSKPGNELGDRPGDQSGAKQGGDKGQPRPGERQGDPKPDSRQPGVKTPGAPSSTPSQDGDKSRTEQGDGEQSGEKPGSQTGDKTGNEPGHKPGSEPGNQPSGEKPGDQSEQQPVQKPGDQGGNKPGEQPGEKPGQDPVQQPGDKPGDKPGSESGGNQSGGQPGKPKSDPGADASDPSTGGPRGEQPGSGPGAKPAPADGAGNKPGGRPGEAPTPGMGEEGNNPDGGRDHGSDAPASPGSNEPGGAGGLQRLQEQIDQLAEREQNAKQAPRVSRALRDRAQQLLNQASPEDREAMERWAREASKEQPDRPVRPPVDAHPWEGETDLVDARDAAGDKTQTARPDPSEHIIAEWFTNQGVDRSGAAATHEMADQIQQASEGAEQAIEQQTVPRRHSELIRRIFGRYTQRVKGQEPLPAPVDAPDAKPAAGSGK